MSRYIIKRLLLMIQILLGISFIVLILIDLAPGDVARKVAGVEAEDWEVEEVRAQLGLSDPLLVRYGRFIWNALHGTFGKSFINKKDVMKDMLMRWPYTIVLATLSVALAVVIGIPIGIFAATNQYSWKDNTAIFLSLFCVSMPPFWFALLLVQFFSVKLGWLPAAGVESWKSWILPTISLAVAYAAGIVRQMRSNMLEVIRQDYIRTARAKGQKEGKVIFKHALRNSLIPVAATLGNTIASSLGGSIIAESIFSVNGVGLYMLNAINGRDWPAVQGGLAFLAVVFSIVMLFIDLLYTVIDPRLKDEFNAKNKMKANKRAAKRAAREAARSAQA